MPTEITGVVLRGRGYGRTLGFPTANLDRRSYSRRRLMVRLGIYAGIAVLHSQSGRVGIAGKPYPAAIVIGPIDKEGLPRIEAHLIGFSGTLYRHRMTLSLIQYLRSYRHFPSEARLKQQISDDIHRVIRILKSSDVLQG